MDAYVNDAYRPVPSSASVLSPTSVADDPKSSLNNTVVRDSGFGFHKNFSEDLMSMGEKASL